MRKTNRKPYQIRFGYFCKDYDASNPFQACMMAFKAYFMRDDYIDTMPISFHVNRNGKEETIASHTIVSLLTIATDDSEDSNGLEHLQPILQGTNA